MSHNEQSQVDRAAFVLILALCQLLSTCYCIVAVVEVRDEIVSIVTITAANVVIFWGIAALYVRHSVPVYRLLVLLGWFLVYPVLEILTERTRIGAMATISSLVGLFLLLPPLTFLAFPSSTRECMQTQFRVVVRTFRRVFPRLAFALAIIATLIAAFYTIENLRWKHAWNNYREEIKATGNWYDNILETTPPPVPDELNFAMTPLLQPLLDYDITKRGFDRYNDLEGYMRVRNMMPYRSIAHRRVFFQLLGDWRRAEPTDFQSFREFYRGETNFPAGVLDASLTREYLQGLDTKDLNQKYELPFSNQDLPAADEVLFAISKYDTELAELATALQRPHSRFPIHYDHDPPADILLPHLADLKNLCVLFNLRALAHLEKADTTAAFADAERVYKLSDTIATEPFAISLLVRLTVLDVAHHAVWEGLRSHRWSHEQIKKIQDRLNRIDLFASFQSVMETERTGIKAFFDDLEMRRDKESIEHLGFLDSAPVDTTRWNTFRHLAPAGWFTANALTACRYTDSLRNALNGGGNFADIAKPRVMFSDEEKDITYQNFLARTMRSFHGVARQVCYQATHINLARTACALELHHLENGNYPASLAELSPTYLPEPLTDHADGEPLRYRPTPDGRYRIYSVGHNLTDENGLLDPNWSPRLGRNTRGKGDWVWAYEPEYLSEE